MTIFFLGAGFSKPAGLPLGDELFSEILRIAKLRGHFENDLKDDINIYRRYVKNTRGKTIAEKEIKLEEFVSYLDIEHYLGLLGSDTWSEHGNRSQVIIKNLIAFVLNSFETRMSDAQISLYEKFVERLKPNDWIFTFNYDTVLEKTLERKNIAYRLYPTRYKNVREYPSNGGEVDLDTEEVIVLKMHGSINWFDASQYKRLKDYERKFYGDEGNPRDLVFDGRNGINIKKLLHEPHLEGDPLRNVYVVENLGRYITASNFLTEAPIIISPSFNKIIYLNPIKEFWYGFRKSGAFDKRTAIIGYSFPEHDEYIRQPLYWFIRHFQDDEYSLVGKKSRLKVVDYKQTEKDIKEFKKRYRFVDQKKTDFYFDGFNEQTLDAIFSED